MSFIAIRTRPVNLEALQWHQPGDLPEIATPTTIGGKAGWGVHSAEHGFQNLSSGDWIVFEGGRYSPRVYSNAGFHAKFEVIES